MTSLRVFPSERLICVFPACAEAHCVLGFPYRCVCSGSRLTVKAGAGAFFFFSPPPQASSFTGEERRGVPLRRGEPTHTHAYTHTASSPHRLRTHLPAKRHRLPALNGPRRRWSPVCTRQRTHSNSGPLPGRPDGKSGFVIHSLSPHVHDEVHLCPSFMRGRTEAAVKWEEDRDGAVALPVIKWWRPFHGPVGWWRSAAGWMLVVETGTGSRPT